MKYESSITYHLKAMANDKVFADKQTERQTDKWTGKKLYAPNLLMWGHKKTQRLAISKLILYKIS